MRIDPPCAGRPADQALERGILAAVAQHALTGAGLRDKIKIMIGGGQIDDQIRKYTGADAYGRDAMTAVNLAKQWTGAA